ncbi:MAG: hypothetical protein WC657_05660 [Candidatus Paceibacterota bacterium]|jgi:hypothetical protein
MKVYIVTFSVGEYAEDQEHCDVNAFDSPEKAKEYTDRMNAILQAGLHKIELEQRKEYGDPNAKNRKLHDELVRHCQRLDYYILDDARFTYDEVGLEVY